MPERKWPEMEPCSWCGGHGITQNHPDCQPDACPSCGGGGEVEARDDRGRFKPWRVVPLPEEATDG